jgi:hypothetical protein
MGKVRDEAPAAKATKSTAKADRRGRRGMPPYLANLLRTEGYQVVDLRAGYVVGLPAGARVLPFVEVRNLLDARFPGSVAINAAGGRYVEVPVDVHLGMARLHENPRGTRVVSVVAVRIRMIRWAVEGIRIPARSVPARCRRPVRHVDPDLPLNWGYVGVCPFAGARPGNRLH